MSQYDSRWPSGRNQFEITQDDMSKIREDLTTNKTLGKFTQDRLNEIWDSLSSEDAVLTAKILTDDQVEQSMSINTDNGQILVSRKPGGAWKDMPSVGSNKNI